MGEINEVDSISAFFSILNNKLKGAYKNNRLSINARGLPEQTFFRGEPRIYRETSNVAGIFREKSRDGYTPEYTFTNEHMLRFSNIFKGLENNFSRLSYM